MISLRDVGCGLASSCAASQRLASATIEDSLFVGLFCREGLGVASESECDVRNEVATPNFTYLCFPLGNLLGDYREFAVERTGVSEITAVRKVL